MQQTHALLQTIGAWFSELWGVCWQIIAQFWNFFIGNIFELAAFVAIATAAIAVIGWILRRFDKRNPTDIETQKRNVLRSFLKHMQANWINHVLEDPIYDADRITLTLETVPTAVQSKYVRHVTDSKNVVLRQSLRDVFQQSGQQLLILGEAGSGKTTSILELTQQLIHEAETTLDDKGNAAIPLILRLANWQNEVSIRDWVITQIASEYRYDKNLLASLIDEQHFIFIFDGLDEVPELKRQSCLKALNRFIAEKQYQGIIISCREHEYDFINAKLQMAQAIRLSPLQLEQIAHFLKEEKSQGLSAFLLGLNSDNDSDAEILKLACNPFMLNIMAKSYQGMTATEITEMLGEKDKRSQIFKNYVDYSFNEYHRKLAIDGEKPRFKKRDVIRWLSWIAQNARLHQKNSFRLEFIEPLWFYQVASNRAKKSYHFWSTLLLAFLLIILSIWLLNIASISAWIITVILSIWASISIFLRPFYHNHLVQESMIHKFHNRIQQALKQVEINWRFNPHVTYMKLGVMFFSDITLLLFSIPVLIILYIVFQSLLLLLIGSILAICFLILGVFFFEPIPLAIVGWSYGAIISILLAGLFTLNLIRILVIDHPLASIETFFKRDNIRNKDLISYINEQHPSYGHTTQALILRLNQGIHDKILAVCRNILGISVIALCWIPLLVEITDQEIISVSRQQSMIFVILIAVIDLTRKGVWQHYLIRMILFRERIAPRISKYALFLQYSSSLSILKRTRIDYEFSHNMLRDYFANMGIQLFPKRAINYFDNFYQGSQKIKTEDYQDAIFFFKEALQSSATFKYEILDAKIGIDNCNDISILYHLGICYFHLKDYTASEKLFKITQNHHDEVIQIHSHLFLSKIYLQQNQYLRLLDVTHKILKSRETVVNIEEKVDGFPNQIEIYSALGWSHARLGNWKDAITHYSMISKKIQDLENTEQIYIYTELAAVYKIFQDVGNFLQYLIAIEDSFDSDLMLYLELDLYVLACYEALQNQWQKALSLLEQSLKEDSEDPQWLKIDALHNPCFYFLRNNKEFQALTAPD